MGQAGVFPAIVLAPAVYPVFISCITKSPKALPWGFCSVRGGFLGAKKRQAKFYPQFTGCWFVALHSFGIIRNYMPAAFLKNRPGAAPEEKRGPAPQKFFWIFYKRPPRAL